MALAAWLRTKGPQDSPPPPISLTHPSYSSHVPAPDDDMGGETGEGRYTDGNGYTGGIDPESGYPLSHDSGYRESGGLRGSMYRSVNGDYMPVNGEGVHGDVNGYRGNVDPEDGTGGQGMMGSLDMGQFRGVPPIAEPGMHEPVSMISTNACVTYCLLALVSKFPDYNI